jgi:hypothetical protein
LSQNILHILLANNIALSYSVKRWLAGVVALITKYQSFINGGHQRAELVTHIVTTTDNNLVLACCILDAIMAEHQYVVNAEDASLTYEMRWVALILDELKKVRFLKSWVQMDPNDVITMKLNWKERGDLLSTMIMHLFRLL